MSLLVFLLIVIVRENISPENPMQIY